MRSVLDYFIEATGVDDQLFVVGELRAADRHRHAGRQPAQHRHPAAARPDPGSRLQGPAVAARRRRRHLRQGQLRRRPVLGRSRHLQGQGRHREVLRLPLQGRPEVAGLVRAGEFRGSRLRSAEDLGRAAGADRPDRRRRRHAVVHRARLGRRHRLAGDRLGRGHHAAHRSRPRSTTSGRATRSRSTTRRSSNALQIFAEIATNDKYVDGGKAAVAATDFRDSPKGLFGIAAEVLPAPPGLVHLLLLPGGHEARRGRRLLLPAADGCRSPNSASRCSAPARCSPSPRIPRRRAPSSSSSKMPLAHEIWMAQSGLLTPLKTRQQGRLRQRAAEEAGRDPASTPRPSASTART